MKNTQRLDKVLSNLGFGTRKEIKVAVKNGLVTIDGQVARDSGMQVDPESSVICYGDKKINYRKFVYLVMNKPAGVVSATFDNHLQTVIDILPDEYKVFDVFPVGRLDRDTEGFLILTNDGQLAHDLLSPKKHVPKTYYVEIDGQADDADAEAFKAGVELDDGYVTLPAQMEVQDTKDASRVLLTIHEGKFHQVKRMFASRGKKVTYLKRLSMGPLTLDAGLKPGQCRELTPDEINQIGGNKN